MKTVGDFLEMRETKKVVRLTVQFDADVNALPTQSLGNTHEFILKSLVGTYPLIFKRPLEE